MTALASLVTGCRSPAEHRAQADQEVYAILEKRRAELGVAETRFSIEPPADSLRQRLLGGEGLPPADLLEALQIAAENSREYQRRKEQMYLVALDLTLERFRFAVQRRGHVGALLAGDLDGANTGLLDGSAGLTKVLGTGAAIVGDLGLTLARDLSRGDGWDLTSDLALSVTQPLLRGFGARIVKEPLTRAERAVVYEVRDFERFRRTFAVEVASRYFRILQQADLLQNERANMDNLETLRLRNEELANAGRLSDIQVDQARQDELRSKNRLIQAEERLAGLLDDFKLFLGLPIEVSLALDAAELERIQGQVGLAVDDQLAIALGLERRLDYLTSLDQIDDAERRVGVAADDLRARLDVTTGLVAASDEGRPLHFDQEDIDWTLRADLDLPIDRIAERNAYRESLITLERQRRAAEELADSIRVSLRDSLRQSATRQESLLIQQGAVELAERRIESTSLNLQAGRADTRDILEAQEALREARNALTAALIDYHLSQLSLWRDMELLRVDEQGLHLETGALEAPAETQP